MDKFLIGNKVVFEGNPPKCTICGCEIGYKPILKCKSRYKLTTCTNENCVAHNNMSYKIRMESIFGKEFVDEFEKNKKKSSRLCHEYWINNGFTENEAKLKIFEIQSKNSSFVKKRGRCDKKTIEKKIGKENVDYFFRKNSVFCKEYWTSRGYSIEEAIEHIKKIQSENSKKGKSDTEKNRKSSWRCPEYWVKVCGCTITEAKEIISKKQSFFSKEKCIEKYGNDEGLKIWEERQKKWQESLHKSGNLHVGYSKISQELFDFILKYYDKEELDYVFYAKKNHEYSIRCDNMNYIYDFTDLNRRKIIEFQGDIYHGNPMIFNENDMPNPFKKDKTCKNLWEYDEKKKQIAEKNGFEIIQIWENDYRKNKKEIIKILIKFLFNEEIR